MRRIPYYPKIDDEKTAKMLKEKREKMLAYCEETEEGTLAQPYKRDLLERKLMISEIPIEYRDPAAYIYACRAIRGWPEGLLYTEIPLLESLILNDIHEWYRRGDKEKAEELKHLHREYFRDLREIFYHPKRRYKTEQD